MQPVTENPVRPEEEDRLVRMLRQLDLAPDGSQRATAAALGVSLGRLNSQLRAAAQAGLVVRTTRAEPVVRAAQVVRMAPAAQVAPAVRVTPEPRAKPGRVTPRPAA